MAHSLAVLEPIATTHHDSSQYTPSPVAIYSNTTSPDLEDFAEDTRDESLFLSESDDAVARATGWAVHVDDTPADDPLYIRGLQYSEGVGTARDLVAAHMWFNIAAMRGNMAARLHRSSVALLLSPIEVIRAQRLAREWLLNEGKNTPSEAAPEAMAG